MASHHDDFAAFLRAVGANDEEVGAIFTARNDAAIRSMKPCTSPTLYPLHHFLDENARRRARAAFWQARDSAEAALANFSWDQEALLPDASIPDWPSWMRIATPPGSDV